MARLLKMTNEPLPANLLLIGGSSYPFKVLGLGPDKKHLIIKCDSPLVTISVLNANPKNAEQTLRMDVSKTVTIATKAKLIAYLGSDITKVDVTTVAMMASIEPRITLPIASSEEGIVSRMLLIENITPSQPGYVSSQQSQTAMQCMLWVLKNRITLGSHNFGTTQDVKSLTEIIKAKNQVAGFENYPSIAKQQDSLLHEITNIANDSSHAKCAAYREYLRNAIEIARGNNSGTDPCPTKLYGWRTAGATSPGPNFVKYKAIGGQDFYTLTDTFLKSASK